MVLGFSQTVLEPVGIKFGCSIWGGRDRVWFKPKMNDDDDATNFYDDDVVKNFEDDDAIMSRRSPKN